MSTMRQTAKLHIVGLLLAVATAAPPPMGWMSWEVFRCNIDCDTDPANCIGERLYRETAAALKEGGYLAAGYKTVSIDDCWEASSRNSTTNELLAEPTRFPSGAAALGTYMRSLGVRFGIYSDAGTATCAGYPGSKGFETTDAQTFADWGVDYLKYDGCNDALDEYPADYPAMGAALKATGRDVTFSCSWPAYLGDDEASKPFDDLKAAQCDLWRNWDDIQCSWSSLASIIDHFGNFSDVLAASGPGHDPDMLLVGNDCVTDDEARTQFAVWSILAAPLIMGNDLRNVSASARDILLNDEAIAVDQDPVAPPGVRVSAFGAQEEVWVRTGLDGGDTTAVALINRDDDATADIALNLTQIMLAVGGGGGASSGVAEKMTKLQDLRRSAPAATTVAVRDIFNRQDCGTFALDDADAFPSFSVPPHGVAFLRLSPADARTGGGPADDIFFEEEA